MGARIADRAVSRHRSNVVHAARLVGSTYRLACGGADLSSNSVETWHENEPAVARRAITCRHCSAALDSHRCEWLDRLALVSPEARSIVEELAAMVEDDR